MKIDATVKKETLYVTCGMLVMSALMQAVFLAIGKWHVGVVYSNLLVGAAMVANFFAMGLTVQKAVSYNDPEKAKQFMKLSQTVRFLAIIAVLAVGVLLRDKVFDLWALLPPLLFNRITVMIRGMMIKDKVPVNDASNDGAGGDPPSEDGEGGAE